MLYSFDIFDTCLTRHYAAPRDLFFDLADDFLKLNAPYGYDQQSIRLFARLRRLAERQTRFLHKGEREDITLQHIYRQLAELLPWRFDLDDAMHLELALEQSSLRAVLPIKRHIEQLRQQGHRIIFISDMYLPCVFIRQCLIEQDIAREDDTIYVSGEWGLTKASGNLFRKVMECEGIQPDQWLHCGDNHHSDVKMPGQLGIQTHYFTGAHLTAFEQLSFNKAPRDCSLPGLSRLVGASRLARLSFSELDHSLTKSQQVIDSIQLKEIITTVAAPLLTAYVAWLLQDAQQKGIKRLYFVSRDGQVLLKIAQKLCAELTDPPELRYLYGSRQAWFLPSVLENDWHDFEWLIRSDSKRIVDLLNRLSIRQDEVMDYLVQYGLDSYLDNPATDKILILFKAFLKDSNVFRIIKTKITPLRENAIAYFYQEGLFNDESWAIVDLGWQLNCQYALSKIIRSIAPEKNVQGYYLAVQNKSVSVEKAGNRFSFIDQSGHGYIKNSCDWLFRSNIRLMIEHLFVSADHPSVLKYQNVNDSIVPVFLDHNCQQLTQLISETIINYTHHIQTNDLFNALNHYADAAVENAKWFFTRPEPALVKSLSNLIINRDQIHDRRYERKLASAMSFKEALRLITGQGYDLQRHVWLEGSAALSSFGTRQLLLMVLMGRNLLHNIRSNS
jgi:predicted HAD superfamily hydrolase